MINVHFFLSSTSIPLYDDDDGVRTPNLEDNERWDIYHENLLLRLLLFLVFTKAGEKTRRIYQKSYLK